jgi:hypothetical protein
VLPSQCPAVNRHPNGTQPEIQVNTRARRTLRGVRHSNAHLIFATTGQERWGGGGGPLCALFSNSGRLCAIARSRSVPPTGGGERGDMSPFVGIAWEGLFRRSPGRQPKTQKSLLHNEKTGAPGKTRTSNPQIRSLRNGFRIFRRITGDRKPTSTFRLKLSLPDCQSTRVHPTCPLIPSWEARGTRVTLRGSRVLIDGARDVAAQSAAPTDLSGRNLIQHPQQAASRAETTTNARNRRHMAAFSDGGMVADERATRSRAAWRRALTSRALSRARTRLAFLRPDETGHSTNPP